MGRATLFVYPKILAADSLGGVWVMQKVRNSVRRWVKMGLRRRGTV